MVETHVHRRPKYVLRGHRSAIHALAFSPDNSRLLTGDADGWLVSWTLAYKRPAAAWRAHENAVLGVAWWGSDVVISHGRDSRLIAWQLSKKDESLLDQTLPVDEAAQSSCKPKVLYELTLNTMNFCSFALCTDPLICDGSTQDSKSKAILLSVPHTLDSEAIDVYQLPSSHRLGIVPAPQFAKAGMAMALALHANSTMVSLAAGYESGHVALYGNASRAKQDLVQACSESDGKVQDYMHVAGLAMFTQEWQCLYLAKPHSQPVLSLAAMPDGRYLVSSSADSIIALHKFAALVSERAKEADEVVGSPVLEQAYLTSKTGHPGQQGLSFRNDGTVFATAGWDGIARIYTWEGLNTCASFEWHREGTYTAAFASVSASHPQTQPTGDEQGSVDHSEAADAMSVSREGAYRGILAARRERQSQQTHWFAVGGKDGKVSLWDQTIS